jgi:hypothetical protein
LERFGNFKMGGQIINTVKCADDLVLLPKEEKVLQDMIDKIIEIGKCYGMEMNVEKTIVMGISKQQLPLQIMIDQKQLQSVESFKYLGSILTNDGKCTCEIKCRIAMAKAAFNKKRTLSTSTLNLELRKKLVKCYVWSIALYGAETWTLRTLDQKHQEVLKCGAGEGWKRSVGLIILEMKMYCLESRSREISYMKYVNGRRTGLVIFYVETVFYNGLLNKKIQGEKEVTER